MKAMRNACSGSADSTRCHGQAAPAAGAFRPARARGRWARGRWRCLLAALPGLLGQPGFGQETGRAADLPFFAPLEDDGPIGYFVAEAAADSAARAGDAELCGWALEDWAGQSGGRLRFEPAAEAEALIRIRFVGPGAGQYGEMRPIRVAGRRGAEVFVRPDTEALGPEIAPAARADPLLRDSIVYLTCLHELGHALGLEHTADFADVMYFFGFGGDIHAFFGRYRSRLEIREDIREVSGLAAGDLAQLRRLYPPD